MQRLAALVRRPRLHLIRFTGCWHGLIKVRLPTPNSNHEHQNNVSSTRVVVATDYMEGEAAGRDQRPVQSASTMRLTVLLLSL